MEGMSRRMAWAVMWWRVWLVLLLLLLLWLLLSLLLYLVFLVFSLMDTRASQELEGKTRRLKPEVGFGKVSMQGSHSHQFSIGWSYSTPYVPGND